MDCSKRRQNDKVGLDRRVSWHRIYINRNKASLPGMIRATSTPRAIAEWKVMEKSFIKRSEGETRKTKRQ